MKPQQFYLATFFDAKIGAPSRSAFVRAKSFAEAESLASKLATQNAGILIELPAPDALPPMLPPRVRNGVEYMVAMPRVLR